MNMAGLFLSAAELQELTGFRSARGQARWLDQHHWRYALTNSRQPRVAREYFAARVGAGSMATAAAVDAAARAAQPNFAALNRR
ncbi:DUF4224 domain-containing protein [Rubrivivax gelatinosus]